MITAEDKLLAEQLAADSPEGQAGSSHVSASVLEWIDCYAWLWVVKRSAGYALRAANLACRYRIACPVEFSDRRAAA